MIGEYTWLALGPHRFWLDCLQRENRAPVLGLFRAGPEDSDAP